MRRDDPVDEPWYEIHFHMTRWHCPSGLSGPLLADIIEAIQDTDRLLLEGMTIVDSYAYGYESSAKRYVRYSKIKKLESAFDELMDRLLVAKGNLKQRWSSVMENHQSQIAKLSLSARKGLDRVDEGYSISLKTIEVDLSDTLKQFLEGIRPGT